MNYEYMYFKTSILMNTRTILQPTIVSEWLIWMTIERFEEILGAKVPIASI
jgi:hypothetical protein